MNKHLQREFLLKLDELETMLRHPVNLGVSTVKELRQIITDMRHRIISPQRGGTAGIEATAAETHRTIQGVKTKVSDLLKYNDVTIDIFVELMKSI
jgi:hypothetical protein